MSIGIDRRSRVGEVLAESGRPDLVEVLIWPALAALTSCPEPHPELLARAEVTAVLHDRVRRCAGAFIRVAADVVALQSALGTLSLSGAADEPSSRKLWRASVVNLTDAYRGVSTLLADIGNDEQHTALVVLFRQMSDVAERVASWLETVEPPERVDPAAIRTPPSPATSMPTPGPSVASNRRRPWFDTEVTDARTWPGGAASRTLP